MVFGFPSGGCWSDPKRVWRRWTWEPHFFEGRTRECNAMQCNLFFMQNKKRLQERFHNLFFWIVTLPKTNMIPKMKVWFRWFPFQIGDFQVESAVHLSRVKGSRFLIHLFGVGYVWNFALPQEVWMWVSRIMTTLWRAMTSAPDAFCALFFDRFRDVMLDGHFRIVIWVMVLYIPKVFDAPMEVGRFSTFFKPKGSPRYLFHKCDGMKFLLFLLMSFCVLRKWLWRLETLLFNEFFLGCKWYYLDQTGNTGKDGTTGTSAGGGGGGGGQGGDSRAGEWWKLMFVSLVVLPQYATFQDMRPYSKTFFFRGNGIGGATRI